MRSAAKIDLKQFSASTKHDLSKVKKTLPLSVFDDVSPVNLDAKQKLAITLKHIYLGNYVVWLQFVKFSLNRFTKQQLI